MVELCDGLRRLYSIKHRRETTSQREDVRTRAIESRTHAVLRRAVAAHVADHRAAHVNDDWEGWHFVIRIFVFIVALPLNSNFLFTEETLPRYVTRDKRPICVSYWQMQVAPDVASHAGPTDTIKKTNPRLKMPMFQTTKVSDCYWHLLNFYPKTEWKKLILSNKSASYTLLFCVVMSF